MDYLQCVAALAGDPALIDYPSGIVWTRNYEAANGNLFFLQKILK
jgi:hypothetical protein